MIAFMDAEFNCGGGKGKKKDMSLIEVALIIVEDIYSDKVIDRYHAYSKPKMNKGLLYPIVKGLTHISQQNVNNGKSFKDVYYDLITYIEQYDITEIYVWGNFDKYGFKWNCALYNEITYQNQLTDKIIDISKDCIKRIGLSEQMALSDIAYVCECDKENHHNAVDDTEILAGVVWHVYNNQFDKRKILEYSQYIKHRAAYNALKTAINRIKESNGDLDNYLRMAMRNDGFPCFTYQKDE